LNRKLDNPYSQSGRAARGKFLLSSGIELLFSGRLCGLVAIVTELSQLK
jgi:hypothetical protein